MLDLIPGSEAHFKWLLSEMSPYWNDLAFVARSLTAMGEENVISVLNRKEREIRRTAPPSALEVTALEITHWDNWHATGGKRPREGQPNHDKARIKVEVELWNKPVGTPLWGGGNKARNSIYHGTAIAMERRALVSYLADKRSGKKIAEAWEAGTPLGIFADGLEALSEAHPQALIGPLCWTANKRTFVPDMAVMIEGDGKAMSVKVSLPDGAYQAKRWTDKRTNMTALPAGALQCRATNRPDYSHWRNSRLATV